MLQRKVIQGHWNKNVRFWRRCYNGRVHSQARYTAVYMLSTFEHYDGAVDPVSGKPQMILDYNATKGGVDTMDQMVGMIDCSILCFFSFIFHFNCLFQVTGYSCKRKTRRWPLAMFFNMIDIMGLAAYVLFMETSGVGTSKHATRRAFLNKLSAELATENIERRSEDRSIMGKFATKNAIEDMLEREIVMLPQPGPSGSAPAAAPERGAAGRLKHQGKCFYCQPLQKNTRKRCDMCQQPICDVHSRNRCTFCP